MPRLLVFNGTPQALESKLVEGGSQSYEDMIRESFEPHLPAIIIAARDASGKI